MGFLVAPKPAAKKPPSETDSRIAALGRQYTGASLTFHGVQAPRAGSVDAAVLELQAAQNPAPPRQALGLAGRGPAPISVETAQTHLDSALSKAEAQQAADKARNDWVASVGGMHHEGRWKHLGRQWEKQTAKVVVPITAITAAALATIPVFGTVASIAVTQAGGGIARVAGAGAAREQGLSGHAAKDAGRKLAKKTRVWGARGGSLGSAANSVAASGGSAPSIAGAVQTGATVGQSIAHDSQHPTTGQAITVNLGGAPGPGAPGAATSPAPGAPAVVTKTDWELIALGAAGLLAAAA